MWYILEITETRSHFDLSKLSVQPVTIEVRNYSKGTLKTGNIAIHR